MTKPQLIAALASRLELTKARAAAIVDTLFGAKGIIAGELARGGKVQIAGFGQFEVRRRAAREVRNPRTGTSLKIAESRLPAFRAGSGLRGAVGKHGGQVARRPGGQMAKSGT